MTSFPTPPNFCLISLCGKGLKPRNRSHHTTRCDKLQPPAAKRLTQTHTHTPLALLLFPRHRNAQNNQACSWHCCCWGAGDCETSAERRRDAPLPSLGATHATSTLSPALLNSFSVVYHPSSNIQFCPNSPETWGGLSEGSDTGIAELEAMKVTAVVLMLHWLPT